MFSKNNKDPLVESAKKVMNENTIRRQVERQLNEEIGIESRKQLPNELLADYDSVLAEAVKKALDPVGQEDPDVDNDGKVTSTDSYLKNRREVIAKNIEEASSKKKMTDDEDDNDDKQKEDEYLYSHRKRVLAAAKKSKKSSVNETTLSAKAARAGKDIGEPGKNFDKIAADAAKRYGSKAAGERVAGAVLANMRNEETEAQKQKVGDVMGEFKKGELHSGTGKKGKKGKIVRKRSQAIAIALNQAGLSKQQNEEITFDSVMEELRATMSEAAFNALTAPVPAEPSFELAARRKYATGDQTFDKMYPQTVVSRGGVDTTGSIANQYARDSGLTRKADGDPSDTFATPTPKSDLIGRPVNARDTSGDFATSRNQGDLSQALGQYANRKYRETVQNQSPVGKVARMFGVQYEERKAALNALSEADPTRIRMDSRGRDIYGMTGSRTARQVPQVAADLELATDKITVPQSAPVQNPIRSSGIAARAMETPTNQNTVVNPIQPAPRTVGVDATIRGAINGIAVNGVRPELPIQNRPKKLDLGIATGQYRSPKVDIGMTPDAPAAPAARPDAPISPNRPNLQQRMADIANIAPAVSGKPEVQQAVQRAATQPAPVRQAAGTPLAPSPAKASGPATGSSFASGVAQRSGEVRGAQVERGIADYKAMTQKMGLTPTEKNIEYNRQQISRTLSGQADQFDKTAKGRYEYLRTGQGSIREAAEKILRQSLIDNKDK